MSSGHSPLLPSQHLAGARRGVPGGVAASAEGSAGPSQRPIDRPLRERLEPIATDRASASIQIVRETARVFREWLLERPDERAGDGREIEQELSRWIDEQAWRGPCATWLDSLRLAWSAAAWEEAPGGRSERLALEMSAWIEDGGEGRPAAGSRLPSRARLAEHAAVDVDRGDTVLITSWSESVALALEAAWRAARRPEVLVGEGLPSLDGRRMARRLSRAGIRVTMVYDAAIASVVARADRVWLATESVGAGAFLGRRGTAALLEECARRDVPTRVLTTSDKLMPGGALRLPKWCERESWLLWEDAPEGVRLESQVYEAVALALAGSFLTEIGPESASALHLRALRVEAAPACGVRPATAATRPS